MDLSNRTKCFLAAIIISLAFFSCAKKRPISPVNTTSVGVAIKGYDPVAYFTDGKPVKGSAEFEYIWKGVKWRFASSGNLEMFKKDPDKYAPRGVSSHVPTISVISVVNF